MINSKSTLVSPDRQLCTEMHNSSFPDASSSNALESQKSSYPQPCNTGVTEPPTPQKISSSGQLDWLAVTFPTNLSPIDTLPCKMSQSDWVQEGRGIHGYRNRLVNEWGAHLYIDGEERMGLHLILTAESLNRIRATGITDAQVCKHVVDNCQGISRLDVAIDVFGGILTPSKVKEAYQSGQVKTPAKSGMMMQQIGKRGETFTLGSRVSDRYLRCYDKAAEQGIADLAWLRFELELKKRRARSLAAVIADSDATRPVINAAIGGFFDMPGNSEFQTVMADKATYIPAEGRKVTNTYRWLIEQVVPALVHYELANPDDPVWDAFQAARQAEFIKQTGASVVEKGGDT